ncbi:MAG: P-loop NTPase fold protein, partial [Pseudanabaenaceae cyanobacterium]
MSEGVSRTEAEEILINFLNDENLKVLLIKGKWGVGKTHLVKNVLKECSKKQSYYGSMFGISSLEQLKGQILVNANQPQLEPHINKSDIRKGWYQKNIRNINRLFNLLLSWIRDKSPEVSKIPKIDDISLLGSIKIPLSGALISIGGDLL